MFGFSKGIVFACATRFLLGVSNVNNPLVKTYIREISDDSNQVGGAVLWVGVVGEDATEGKGGGGKPRLLTCLQRRHRRNLPDPFSPNPSQTRMFSIRSLCYSLGRALGPLVRLSCLGVFFFCSDAGRSSHRQSRFVSGPFLPALVKARPSRPLLQRVAESQFLALPVLCCLPRFLFAFRLAARSHVRQSCFPTPLMRMGRPVRVGLLVSLLSI